MAASLITEKAYTLAKGKAMWCPGDTRPSKNSTVGYRKLGNAPAMAYTLTLEMIEMESSMEGGNILLDQAVKAKKCEGTLTIVDLGSKNLELFNYGELTEEVQASQTDTDVVFDSVILDLYNPIGYYNITSVTVKDDDAGSPGTTTYVEGDDYDYLPGPGMIRFLSSGDISASDKIHVLTTAPAVNTYKVKGLTLDTNEGHLAFFSKPAKGARIDFFAYCDLYPEGEFAMIGDDWSQLALRFKALSHTSYDSLIELRHRGII